MDDRIISIDAARRARQLHLDIDADLSATDSGSYVGGPLGIERLCMQDIDPDTLICPPGYDRQTVCCVPNAEHVELYPHGVMIHFDGTGFFGATPIASPDDNYPYVPYIGYATYPTDDTTYPRIGVARQLGRTFRALFAVMRANYRERLASR